MRGRERAKKRAGQIDSRDLRGCRVARLQEHEPPTNIRSTYNVGTEDLGLQSTVDQHFEKFTSNCKRCLQIIILRFYGRFLDKHEMEVQEDTGQVSRDSGREQVLRYFDLCTGFVLRTALSENEVRLLPLIGSFRGKL